MAYKKLVPIMYIKDDDAYTTRECRTMIDSRLNAVQVAERFDENGADEIIVVDLSYNDSSFDRFIDVLRDICKNIDIPVLSGGNVRRLEDINRYFYGGACKVFLEDSKDTNRAIIQAAADRYGSDKIGMICTEGLDVALDFACENNLSCILVSNYNQIILNKVKNTGLPVIVELSASEDGADIIYELSKKYIDGVSGPMISSVDFSFMEAKNAINDAGIPMNVFLPSVDFGEFKLDDHNLIPVVVQDYRSDEVLMVAYMNQEAYETTIRTGRMTYYSRSRKELWVKGETSGHYQYVRSIEIDCDNDTLLAKVKQIGAACHTGNRSCFYRNLVSTPFERINLANILDELMVDIEAVRLEEKDNSYIRYLFERGLDEVLRKLSENSADLLLSSKNNNPEAVKKEISDYIFHSMVLMSMKGLSWEDILKELTIHC